MISLYLGDALDILPTLAADSVDAICTDPPAGIGFMSKEFDTFKDRDSFVAFLSGVLAECLRIAKPGSVMLCWAIPRTSHWTGLAIESAGWQIEDRISHHFGTGFPKHKSKLKPATEDWWLARKPGPKWLGVDACRISLGGEDRPSGSGNRTNGAIYAQDEWTRTQMDNGGNVTPSAGRWPPNLVMSHGPDCGDECGEGCPVRLMGEQSGEDRSGWAGGSDKPGMFMQGVERCHSHPGFGDSGTAARFFPCFNHDPFIYAAKASRRDRNEGCEGMPERRGGSETFDPRVRDGIGEDRQPLRRNHHPTVKSVHLMRWLCRLACPPGGTILDPFMGSGSTGKACLLEGFRFIGVERDPEYHELARRRIEDPHPLFAALEEPA